MGADTCRLIAAVCVLVTLVASASAALPVAPHGILALTGGYAHPRLVVLDPGGQPSAPIGPQGDPGLLGGTVSPDGRHLAYTDAKGLWLSAVDGRNPKQLEPGDGGSVGGETWSPDGRSIVFTILRARANSLALLQTRIDTGVTSTVFSKSGFNVEAPQFSPDGHKIAFVSRSCCSGGDRYRGIYLIDADGTHVRHLTRLFSPDGGSVAWSPDGSHIAFVDLRPAARAGKAFPRLEVPYAPLALFVIDVATGRRHTISSFSATRTPVGVVWSPDGRAFALHVYGDDWPIEQTDRLYLMRSDGSGLRLLSRTAAGPLQWR